VTRHQAVVSSESHDHWRPTAPPVTLYPGDVLWVGTDGAQADMKDGSVGAAEVNDIGVLRNPVIEAREISGAAAEKPCGLTSGGGHSIKGGHDG
jgi:hypothetical protein